MMELWKWNLAFQCVVNIGVRGSEGVRTRVVEADMVPVIATILDNYIKVIDKCRDKVDCEQGHAHRRSLHATQPRHNQQSARSTTSSRQTFQHRANALNENRSFRRQEPPSAIEIPQPVASSTRDQQSSDIVPMELTPTLPQLAITSPSDNGSFSRHHLHHHHHHYHHHHHHHHHRSQDGRQHSRGDFAGGSRHAAMQSLPANVASMDAGDGIGLRPVRDVDRLPSMLPALQSGITSQPESPTTPSAPFIRHNVQSTRGRRLPSVRQQQSTSGDSDEGNGDEAASEASVTNEILDEPMLDIQTNVDIQGAADEGPMLDNVSVAATLGNVSEGQGVEAFNITHQSANDGSIINANVTPTNNNIGFPPPIRAINVVSVAAQAMPQIATTRYLLDRSAPPGIIAATPRDEDVLMSLQLLAYVSKYCNLRSYFQQSHLVPKLKVGDNFNALDDTSMKGGPYDEDMDGEEEYLLLDDFNIFPLVEKFTVRHHSQDMQHWAGVVMRNLCRKDDARGGIRQCAYYECGKWEQWTRQFAKCRRCRRTKYCSKECQKQAWIFHRQFVFQYRND